MNVISGQNQECVGDQTGSFGDEYCEIEVVKVSPNIGAEIRNIDLTSECSEVQKEELQRAFVEYQVLFFEIKK